MRTTLTLDPDVARALEEEAHRQRKPFKQVVNETIRRGRLPHAATQQQAPYRIRPHKTALRNGIDAGSFNRLADELEGEAVSEKLQAS
jgi:hypothetical protein